jgi:c-di-GMP-binding flagellar brake protein YcgR
MTASRTKTRRLYIRVQYQDPILVQPIGGRSANRVFYMLAEDLSEGGVKLLSPELMAVDTRLLLDISNSNPPAIHIVGRVVWVRQHGADEHWDLGVTFVELDHGSRARLKTLVAERRKTEQG